MSSNRLAEAACALLAAKNKLDDFITDTKGGHSMGRESPLITYSRCETDLFQALAEHDAGGEVVHDEVKLREIASETIESPQPDTATPAPEAA